MLKLALLLAFALSALLGACGGGDPFTPKDTDHPIEFVMQDEYSFGEAIEIKIRNNGDQSYLYNVIYAACFDLNFYDESHAQHRIAGELFERQPLPPGLFIIPQGTHCDLPGEDKIKPGELVVLLTWYQHECIKDNWSCVDSIHVNPVRYRIVGEFSTADREGKTVADRSFVITPTGKELFLEISVTGDAPLFDKDKLEVIAGSEVVLRFSNVSRLNQHNWVMVQEGTGNDVAARGMAAGPDYGWVQPEDPNVIAGTRLVNPGDIGGVHFTALPAGTYQFICTFPGHNFTMVGDFEVVGAMPTPESTSPRTPIIEEDVGILRIKRTQEYKALVDKYGSDQVSVKAVNLDDEDEAAFLRIISDGFLNGTRLHYCSEDGHRRGICVPTR